RKKGALLPYLLILPAIIAVAAVYAFPLVKSGSGSGAPAASFVLPGRPRGVPSTTATPGRTAERPVPGSRGSLPCAFANRP
ncbi:hypothetical protein, partial [Streptomyces albidoflavus]|uniref:hypothetical protein n=1 Tax=Streptomyces albidoflavus TaxID=1886 RepID=UPI0033AC4B54